MISVFLDTTVFREDPLRRRIPFKTIERLAQLGKVIIHLSDVSKDGGARHLPVRQQFADSCLQNRDKLVSTHIAFIFS